MTKDSQMVHRMARRITVGVLAATSFVALVVIVAWSSNNGFCSVSQIIRVVSPGGRWEAVSYNFGCGVLGNSTRAVSVLATGKAVKADGNLYRARGGAATPVWVGSDRLLIRYTDAGQIFRIKKKMGAVTVAYQLTPIAYRTDQEAKSWRVEQGHRSRPATRSSP